MFLQTHKVKADGSYQIVEDQLVEDSYIKFYVNNEFVEEIHCLASDLEELIIGKLLYQGMKLLRWSFLIKPGSVFIDVLEFEKIEPRPVGVKTFVSASILIDSMKDLLNNPLHKQTGAVHLAGLYTVDGQCLVKSEDVGRHNAVDKVIGWLVKNKIDPSNKMLLSSGRLPLEMALKCILSGIEILASKAPVMASAIEFSEKLNLTLIGFVREGRMNVYTHKERIKEVSL